MEHLPQQDVVTGKIYLEVRHFNLCKRMQSDCGLEISKDHWLKLFCAYFISDTGRQTMGENLQWTGTNHGGVNDSLSLTTHRNGV